MPISFGQNRLWAQNATQGLAWLEKYINNIRSAPAIVRALGIGFSWGMTRFVLTLAEGTNAMRIDFLPGKEWKLHSEHNHSCGYGWELSSDDKALFQDVVARVNEVYDRLASDCMRPDNRILAMLIEVDDYQKTPLLFASPKVVTVLQNTHLRLYQTSPSAGRGCSSMQTCSLAIVNKSCN